MIQANGTKPLNEVQHIELTKNILALPSAVWQYLTNSDLMKQWMGEEEMKIEIITDWKVGSPIIIKGFHHVAFENKGTVVDIDPYRILKYDYISSISRLTDTPENRTSVEFKLTPFKNQTSLTLTLRNFPTEAIFKHVDFYWRTTIEILKKSIEASS
jgi:uncharacterized protein YndB with AHSA1/START domain